MNIRSIKQAVYQLRRRALNLSSPSSWLVELGLKSYESGPWSTTTWDTAYENGQLNYFSQLSEWPRYSVLMGFLAHIEEQRGTVGRVLDVGCGNGLLYQRTRQFTRSHWTGVDLSKVAIDEALVRVARNRDDVAKFYCEDLLESSHLSSSDQYDAIIINEVLNMCSNPNKLLQLCKKSLSTDGMLLISAWRHRGDRQLWQMIRAHFKILELVVVKSASSGLAPRGWRLAILSPGA